MLTHEQTDVYGNNSVEISLTGQQILENPLLNKGTAFSEEEQREFHLLGLVPPHVATIEEQMARTYQSFLSKTTDLERYIFLASLQDRNEVLFYRLFSEHIREMSPIVYTPVVGLACQTYSRIYRRPRGLYISYTNRGEIETILGNSPVKDPQVIVVTDGERILGLGDLGVGGMGIPVGKLALYTLCAGIHPTSTLPITLDVGTNNTELLNDPLYLGLQQNRVRGADYDAFIEQFVQAVKKIFPHVLLQWEDFAKQNARPILNRYRDTLCTFNDDIQGTGAVTLAGLLAAVKAIGSKIGQQRVIILGAGSAATGIAEQIVAAMISEGLSQEHARALIWLVDSHGLVHTGRGPIEEEKRLYARPYQELMPWSVQSFQNISLKEVVHTIHPTILIGTAAQTGVFSEEIVRDMAAHVERPIIFPLSNPTSKSEAVPADVIAWTNGRALIATGSPFDDVQFLGQSFTIGQCNNMFIFPGMGLGIISAQANRVTNTMFIAAARALSELSPIHKLPTASLFPRVEDVREVSFRVAMAVGIAAQQEGVAPSMSIEELTKHIDAHMWVPRYPHLKKAMRTF